MSKIRDFANRLLGNSPVEFCIKDTEEYRVVSKSEYFDRDYYLSNYPDLVANDVDPVEHYIIFGWKEKRIPSQKMNVIASSDAYHHIEKININPVIYFESNPGDYIKALTEENEKKKSCGSLPTTVSVAKNNAVQKNEGNNLDIVPMLNVMMFSLKQYKQLTRSNSRLVLLVSHTLENTGAPRAIINMAMSIKESGNIPIILSFKNGALKKDCDRNGIPVLLEPLSRFKNKLDFTTIRFFDSFDCIILNTIVSLSIAPALEKVKSYKIAWIHEGKMEFEKSKSTIDYGRCFRYIDEVFAGGYYAKTYADNYLPKNKKSKILLYGIEDKGEIEIIDNQIEKEGKIRISVLGTLCERKGQDLVVDALNYIDASIMDKIQVDFVGSERDANITKKLNSALSEFSNVHYFDEMPLDDLLNYMKNEMDILLCPSRDDPMPIVVTEAMRLKKVVIVSQNTGTFGFINNEENGYVLNELSAHCVAKIIENVVFSYDDKYRSIGENAYTIYKDNFTLNTFNANVKKIMEKCDLAYRRLWDGIL